MSDDVLRAGIKSIVETLLVLSDSVMENPDDTGTLERLDFLLVETLSLAQHLGFEDFTPLLTDARWRRRDRRSSP